MSSSCAEALEKVQSLIEKGNYQKALNFIERFKKEQKLNEEELLKCNIVQSSILEHLGNYSEAIKLAEQAMEESISQDNILLTIDSVISLTESLLRTGDMDKGLSLVKKYENVIEKIDELTEKELIFRKCQLKRLKGSFLNQSGKLDEALENFEKSFKFAEEIDNKAEIAKLLTRIGGIYGEKGELGTELEFGLKALSIQEKIGNKQEIANSLNNLGLLQRRNGNLAEALEYLERSLKYREEVGNKGDLAASYNNIGIIHSQKGELEKALNFFILSLQFYEELGNKNVVAAMLLNISTIHRQRGELDIALKNLENSLTIFQEVGNKGPIAAAFYHIGLVYHQKGKKIEAENNLKQCLKLREEIGNDIVIADVLFKLIIVSVDFSLQEQAKMYLTCLEEIQCKVNNKLVDQRLLIAQALLLKTGTRTKDRVKAEELLVKVLDDEIADSELRVYALLNHCEILIDELRITGEKEVLVEIENLVQKLMEVATNQNSFSLIAETYWLQAQLALLNLNLKNAKNLLNQAQLIAEEKGFQRLAMKIARDYDRTLDQLNSWELLIQKNALLDERLEFINLEGQLLQMINQKEIILPVLEPEEPVLLIILNQAGTTVFADRFLNETQLDETLIGGFLSAISSFVSEVFASPGHIERIKHQEYTLVLRFLKSLLFTYVYKGQSYEALRKLGSFMGAITKSEHIWSALLRTNVTIKALHTKHKMELEKLSNKIFAN